MLSSYSLLTVPSEGPKVVSFDEVNQTSFNISWAPLAREERNGIIIGHEIKREKASTEEGSKPSIGDSTYSNSANNFALVTGFQPGCNYSISVRAFTSTGGGPFGEKKTLKISSKSLSSAIKIEKSRFSHVVNTQGKSPIVPILKVIDLQNSNTFFDILCHQFHSFMLPSPDPVPPYWEVKPITNTEVELNWINPSLRPTEVSNYTVRILLL